MSAGCIGIIIYQILMEKRAPQNGCFFVRFLMFNSTIVVFCNHASSVYRLGYHEV